MTDLFADRLFLTNTIFSALFGVNCTNAVPPRSPLSLNSINLFLPLDTVPSVIGSAVGEPELPADDRVSSNIPSIA